MKLFVLGATGRIGTEILDLALEHGHEVTAFVRAPQKLAPARNLIIRAGDPRDRALLATCMVGHAAVLSALGPRGGEGLHPSTPPTDCATAMLAAMKTAGVARVANRPSALLSPW